MCKYFAIFASIVFLVSPMTVYGGADIIQLEKYLVVGQRNSQSFCEGHLARIYPFPKERIVRDSTKAKADWYNSLDAIEGILRERLESRAKREENREILLTILKYAKREHLPMSRELLQAHSLALLNIRDRIIECADEGHRFGPLDIKNYAELVYLAAQNIFFQNPPGQNPLRQFTPYFTEPIRKFGVSEKYYLLTAFLAGLDLRTALRTDKDNFVPLIHWWNLFHYSGGMKSQVANADKLVQAKINHLARSREFKDLLSAYVVLPSPQL